MYLISLQILADEVDVGNNNYGFIKPEYLKPELSTKLYLPTYSYLARFHSEDIFLEVCKELEMPMGYLLEPDNWISVLFGAKFAALITEKTGDPEVYRKIGHFYFSAENLNPFELNLIKSLSPFLVLKMAEQFYRKRNAVCHFNLTKLGIGRYKFEMSSETDLYYEMALNSFGILEAFQKLYALDLFQIKLEVDSKDQLRKISITMSFAAIQFYLRRSLFLVKATLAGFGIGYLLTHAETYIGMSLIPVMTAAIYLLGFIAYNLSRSLKVFRSSTEDYYNKVREKNVSVYEKSQLLERRFQEAKLLKDLSAELIGCSNPHMVIERCLTSIKDKFRYQRAAVFLISDERKKLYLANSIGFDSLPLDPNKIEFIYPNPDKQEGFIATILERGETKLILDIETYKSILKPQNRFLLDALNVGSLIISPIQSGKKKFGAVILIRDATEGALDNTDKFLIENIATQLSLYFESAMNFANEIKLRSIFQKYVPRTVLEQLTEHPGTSSGALSPQRKEICSIFMDLRGFTSACDGASPERAFSLINQFAEFATSHLAANGAIIDNIIGDEIVSFFPQDHVGTKNYIFRALSAAHQIQSEFAKFSEKLRQNGFAELRLGIGIHCGEASVGSVGGDAKMNYTALGANVNIASRLQSLTKKFDNSPVTIILSKNVVDQVNAADHFSGRVHEELLRGTSEATSFVVLVPGEISEFMPGQITLPEEAA